MSTYGIADEAAFILHARAKTSDAHTEQKSQEDTSTAHMIRNPEPSNQRQLEGILRDETGLGHRTQQVNVNEIDGDLVEVTIDDEDCMPINPSSDLLHLGFINALNNLTPDVIQAELQNLEAMEAEEVKNKGYIQVQAVNAKIIDH